MYTAAGQPDRNELVQRFLPLVKRVAYHLMARLPANVQFEDLVQNGMLGLLDAIDRFEEGFGAQFETYATQRVLVSDLVITHTRKLRLATYGRGLFEREMVPAVPVTVTLLKFEGKTNGTHAELNWQTTAELNLDRFEIERSIGSTQNFQKAGTVAARR